MCGWYEKINIFVADLMSFIYLNNISHCNKCMCMIEKINQINVFSIFCAGIETKNLEI